MKFKLIAIDVDGTLLRPDQTVAPETIDAIAAADAAGIRVCLATGRSYVETMPAWRQLRLKSPYEPMILIGGALVAEPDTGRTLYQRTIPHELAGAYAQGLCEEGYSALGIVDAWRHGVDYLVVPGKDIEHVQRRWFSQMNVQVRRVESLNGDAAHPPVLRINVVAPIEAAGPLTAKLRERFGTRLNIHSILAPNYGVTVVEAFAPAVSKWAAITYVAQGLRVGPGQIVAIGDDINDLPMISAAGLGVAMPKAPPVVKAAAKAIAEPTLAEFLRNLIARND